MLLTALGLSLDIVGAWVLAIGLFRGEERIRTGPLGASVVGRSQRAAARDRSYGAVGGAFLTLGFLGQILGDLGIGPGGDRRTNLASAALLLLVATAVARAALPWFQLQDENLW